MQLLFCVVGVVFVSAVRGDAANGFCDDQGNRYTPIVDRECGQYDQAIIGDPDARSFVQDCPAGQAFDVEVCVCVPADNIRYCGAGPRPFDRQRFDSLHNVVTTPAPKTGYCLAYGNRYTPLVASECTSFSQTVEADPSFPAQVHECHGNLVFDTATCVCNFPSQVKFCGPNQRPLDFDNYNRVIRDKSNPVTQSVG